MGSPVSTMDLSRFTTASDLFNGNQVLNWGYTNIPGTYDYFVWADSYIIDNIWYTDYISDTVTLADGDGTFDRLDGIVINSTIPGTFQVIPGTPSALPTLDDIDESTQVLMTFVLVANNTVAPDVTTYQVFNDNLGEITEFTSVATVGAARIDLASADFAQLGATSMKFR